MRLVTQTTEGSRADMSRARSDRTKAVMNEGRVILKGFRLEISRLASVYGTTQRDAIQTNSRSFGIICCLLIPIVACPFPR
jgi:hypothetical protein